MKRTGMRTSGAGASTGKKGALGESRAAEYLRGMGYVLVDNNFRSRVGEIDIIAEKDGVLAFVEVKAWDAFGEADLEYSIGRVKRRRIAETARFFLARRPELADMRMRFDVILCSGGGDPVTGVRHIEDAFNGAVD